MSGWSTLFFICAILFILLAVLCLAMGSIALFIGCVVSALTFLFFRKLCDCVTEIMKNQKDILGMLNYMTDK